MVRVWLGAATALVMASTAWAQVAAPTPAATLPRAYLSPQTWPNAAIMLPPAPATGSAAEAAELATFRASRRFKDTPRWALAQADVPTGVPALLDGFSCALDAQIAPIAAPRLTGMMSRLGLTVGQQVASVKEVFKRPRPYMLAQGDICVPRSKALDDSPDYPSGHATWGWAFGLILSELAPDRATQVMARARAFGDSRAVCGVHTRGAVDAGRMNASAMVAALHGDPQFRADLDAVRTEFATARAVAPRPEPGACRSQAEQVAISPY